MDKVIQFTDIKGETNTGLDKPVTEWNGNDWAYIFASVYEMSIARHCDPWDLFAKLMQGALADFIDEVVSGRHENRL